MQIKALHCPARQPVGSSSKSSEAPSSMNGTGHHRRWRGAAEQAADQARTARDLEMPEGEPDEDRRLAGAPAAGRAGHHA
jgi:hypothetical protein